jgi:hypothetical protein
MRRMPRRTLPLTVGLAALLASCASGAGGSPPAVRHPAGDQLVLRVAFQGGFVGLDVLLSRFPTFTLLGEGRVIVEGAQDMIYPGTALPAVLVRRLNEAGMQAVLAEVLDSGAFGSSGEFRGAQNFITDSADTVFTLRAGGREVTVVVYALNELVTSGNTGGVSAHEVATYRALSHLKAQLTTLDQWLPSSDWTDPSWKPFVPESLRLVVRNATADPPDESGIANQLIPWPGSSAADSFGAVTTMDGSRCGGVSGQEATAWYAALTTANTLTRFVQGGDRYQVIARLLLPDEPLECPGPSS